MFAYCLNTPVNRVDASGSISTVIVRKIAKAIISGLITAIAESATGGTFGDVANGFIEGFTKSLVSDFNKYLKGAVVAFDVLKTIYDCHKAGATLGNALLAGAVQLLSSVLVLSDFGIVIDTLLDMTVGLGLSTFLTSYKKSIIADASKKPQYTPSNYPKPQGSTGWVNPSNAPDYQPSYNGFGFHFSGYIPDDKYRIPGRGNFGWLL